MYRAEVRDYLHEAAGVARRLTHQYKHFLTSREIQMLMLYYYQGWNLGDLSSEFGVTRARVHQLLQHGRGKLKHLLSR